MFCTVCAAANAASAATCARCGATLAPRIRMSPRARAGRATFYITLIPVIAIVLALSGLGGRNWQAGQRHARAYAAASELAADGRLIGARAAFAELGGFRDAEERVAELDAVILPLRDATRAAGDLLASGRAAEAIAAATAIVRQVVDLREAIVLLEEAREQHRAGALAKTDHLLGLNDWRNARVAIRAAAQADPLDPVLADRLAEIEAAYPSLLGASSGDISITELATGEQQVILSGQHASWVVWSPDRTRIAFTSQQEENQAWSVDLWVADADGSNSRLLAQNAFPFGAPSWSPDGRHLVYITADAFDREVGEGYIGLRLVNLETGLVEDLTGTNFDFAASVTWSPDGRQVAFVNRRILRRENSPYLDVVGGDVYVLDLATRQWTNLTNGRIRDGYWIAWSPRGDQMLILTQVNDWQSTIPNRLYRLDVSTGEIDDIDTGGLVSSYPAWSPDGTMFALAQDDRTVRLWIGDEEVWFRLPMTVDDTLSWAPDSSALIAPPQNRSEPVQVIHVGDDFGRVEAAPALYDTFSSGAGPPQWSSRTPPLPTSPLPSGTALD